MQKRFTINKKNSITYELQCSEGIEPTITVDTTHKKFDWIRKNEGRVIAINKNEKTGRISWNSQKDYHGAYNQIVKAKDVNVKLTSLSDLNIDDSLFIPLPTQTVFDKFVSTDGGFMPGSNLMCAGAPGIGKTTVLLDLLANLHNAGKRCLFISAEMNQIDMSRYLKRFPNWSSIPIMFLSDYTDSCAKSSLESVLNQGWDLVLTDSYTEVNDTIKESCDMTRGKTEKWFLDLMSSHNTGHNKLKKYTTFITILQLSKGGVFVGSNKLKHLTTSMMNLKWDGAENNGRRYMEFDKNRVGEVGKKLYYSLNDGVTFDEGRYSRDLLNDKLVKEEKEQLENESDVFDNLFGLNEEDTVEKINETQAV